MHACQRHSNPIHGTACIRLVAGGKKQAVQRVSMPSTCIQVSSANVEQPKQLNIMTSVTSEQLLETSLQVHQKTHLLSTSACYAALQQRYPRGVVLAHIGLALCFKIVEEADKVPGKCLSSVGKKGEEKKKKERRRKRKRRRRKRSRRRRRRKRIHCNLLYSFCLFVICFGPSFSM